jgi:PAS domain S-box-containing protein
MKDDEDRLLRSVALQNANSILIARQRAERRSEAYLAEAQRLSHTGSFGWRPSTGEITWSEETFRIFQYDPTTKATVELILQRTHPEDAALVKQTIERASQDGKDFDHEYRLVMPDSSVKYVHVAAHALSDESGSIEFVGAVMDVTSVKQAEGKIRQIIDTIPAYAWSALPDGSVDFTNERFLEFTGRSMEELIGWGWRSTHHPDDIHRQIGVWRTAIATGQPMESEVRVRRKDGDYRWLLVRNVPLRDGLGNVVKWYGTGIEIEDRKRAEVLLAGEKRLLEMIARGDSLAFILDALCRLVEEVASSCLSSVLLFDPDAKCLRHGAAPSLPIPYTKSVDGLGIGPSAGSSGTAAYRAEPVIVSDIATDPLWADYRDLALPYGLRACWSTPILSSEGKVLGTFATYYREPRNPTPQEHNVIEQITHLASIAIEREQAEGKLKRSEAHLHEAQRLGRMGSWAHNVPRGTFVASPELLRMVGRDPDEAIPNEEMLRKSIHPEDRPFIEEAFRQARSEKTDFEFDHRIVLADGSIKYVHSVAHPVLDDSGTPVEYIGTIMDVTERKRAEEALRQSEEQWRDLFENNPTMYFMVNAAGTVMAVNPFGAQQLGYQVDELVGQSVLTVFYEPDREAVQRNFALCLKLPGDSVSWELRKVRKDGSMIWVRETARAILRGNEQVVLVACEDITEKKQAEEALHQAQADLAHVSRMTTMGELTASLAHEVNQPIAAAVTNANTCLRWLAADTPNLEEARAAAMRIVKDGTRAAEIIKRIRLLFKKGTPEREWLDVNEVVREMIVLLRGEATRYAISIRTDLAAELPLVMGDRVQLQQVLMNLIMNSIDAMKEVDWARELTIKSQQAENEQLLVSVTDTGAGLPPQQADQIFNAFFTTKPHGTGMGLRISRSIIESHGGRLWAADNSPRGASFYLTLPTKVEAQE